MANNSWRQVRASQQGAGAALASSTTATSLLLGQAKDYLPAGILSQVGSALTVRAGGKISSAGSTPGTFTLDFRLGSTVVWTSSASATLTVSQTNVAWYLELHLVAQSIGNGTLATLLGTGLFSSPVLAGTIAVPFATPAAGNGFDSTTSNQIDLFGTFSVSSASNSATCQWMTFETDN